MRGSSHRRQPKTELGWKRSNDLRMLLLPLSTNVKGAVTQRHKVSRADARIRDDHHLNTGWGYIRERPLTKISNDWHESRDKDNQKRMDSADSDCLAELAHWRLSHPELSAVKAVEIFPCGGRKRVRLLRLLKASYRCTSDFAGLGARAWAVDGYRCLPID
jgi:hypothetical protein